VSSAALAPAVARWSPIAACSAVKAEGANPLASQRQRAASLSPHRPSSAPLAAAAADPSNRYAAGVVTPAITQAKDERLLVVDELW